MLWSSSGFEYLVVHPGVNVTALSMNIDLSSVVGFMFLICFMLRVLVVSRVCFALVLSNGAGHLQVNNLPESIRVSCDRVESVFIQTCSVLLMPA